MNGEKPILLWLDERSRFLQRDSTRGLRLTSEGSGPHSSPYGKGFPRAPYRRSSRIIPFPTGRGPSLMYKDPFREQFMETKGKILSVGEVADRLRMSERWVRKETLARRLPGFKLGAGKKAAWAFYEEDIEAIIKSLRLAAVNNLPQARRELFATLSHNSRPAVPDGVRLTTIVSR